MLWNGRIARRTLASCRKIVHRVFGPRFGALLTFVISGAATAALITAADARTLSFDSTPVTDAVAQIDSWYGVQIELGAGLSESRLVTFDVNDADGPGACLDAVNALANDLNADYDKQFIVSKIVDGSEAPPPQIDAADAPVVATEASMPAEDAIKMIAGIDGASVRFYNQIVGDVTLPSGETNADQAAMRVAEETSTEWRSVYLLTPRGSFHSDVGAIVVGYTASGSPITMLPDVTFRTAKDLPPPEPAATSATGSADAHSSSQSASTGQSSSNPGTAAAATASQTGASSLATPNPQNEPVIIGGPSGQNGSPFMSIGTPSPNGISTFSGSPAIMIPGSTYNDGNDNDGSSTDIQ